MKKYYIKFKFIQGDYEVYLKQVFESELSKEEAAHNYILDYYGSDVTSYDAESEYFSMDCDGVLMELYDIKEVSEQDFEILKKYL